MSDPKTTPQSLSWLDNRSAVEIHWEDGHTSRYRAEYLRTICPCAECKGTHESPPLFSEPAKPKKLRMLSTGSADKARQKITVQKSFPVGNYGIGFLWGDGHKDGLYAFSYLRDMCPSTVSEDSPTEQ